MGNYCGRCFQESVNEWGICQSCGYEQGANREAFPMALPPGSILYGRYIVGRVLGQGGFGITYTARDHQTGRTVAIKEFFPDTMATRMGTMAVRPFAGERGENFLFGRDSFLEEARMLAEFQGHPNIVQVHVYFEENGTAYFAMEYVEGINFLAYIRSRGGRLTWEETSKILLPVMGALEAVHSRGLIHRDVTPDNIYISQSGTVKLLDFGAARYSLGNVSRSLDVILKHGFAPKEQYKRRGRQGPYTDVYALGATFYYALTGVRPDDAIERQDEDDMPLPSQLGAGITQAQENVILKAMAVNPEDRYQSMPEFRAELARASDQAAVKRRQAEEAAARERQRQAEEAAARERQRQAEEAAAREKQRQAEETAGKKTAGTQKTAGTKSGKGFLGIAAVAVAAAIAALILPQKQSDSIPGQTDAGTSREGVYREALNTPPSVDVVLTEKVETYTYQDGSLLEMYFDSDDREVARVYRDREGAVRYQFTASYDAQGNVLEQKTCGGGNTLLRTDTYIRNEEGNWTSYTITLGDGSLYRRTTRSWAEDGKLESYVEYGADGRILTETLREEEKDGSIFWTDINADGTREKWWYDEEDNYHCIAFDADGKKTGSRENWRSADGTARTYLEYDAGGKLTFKSESLYDDQERLLSTSSYGDGHTLTRRSEYTYDAQGRETVCRSYKADGSLSEESCPIYGPADLEIGTDRTWYNDSGPSRDFTERVKSILEEEVLGMSQSRSDRYNSNTCWECNILGQRTLYRSYDLQGQLTYEAHYRFDENGEAAGSNSSFWSYHENGRVSYESHSEYDAQGASREHSTGYDESGRQTSSGWRIYDADNNVVDGESTSISYGDDGSKTVYTFDHEYNQLKKERFDAAGRLISSE